jgi:hypothetical protein
MFLHLKRVIAWRKKLKTLKFAARRHTQDRKKYRTAGPPIKRWEETTKNGPCLQASRTNLAMPLIVVTDVDGMQATPGSW